MIIAGNQPYFIPYIAYWQLIKACDVFLIADNYAFIKAGWIQRNRILCHGKPLYYRIEISKKSDSRLINQTEIAEIDVEKKLKTLFFCYHSAPYFEQGFALMKKIFAFKDRNVNSFLVNSIKIICEYLGIKTKIMFSSELEGNNLYKREYRIYDACKRLGGTTFINAIGGKKLYSKEDFAARGIDLKFIHSRAREYKQFDNEFVPGLSILDVIMFNSVQEISEMLDEYTLE